MGILAKLTISLTIASAGCVLDCYTPIGLATWLLQLAVVWATNLWAARREVIAVAVVCSAYVVLGFWFSPRSGLPMWIDVVNRLLGVAAIWLLVHTCLRQKAAQLSHQKVAAELNESDAKVRILSGLLPICASCKKIRNEAGSWEQFETYIRDHSQAEFTHGLCEDCIARLYPDLAPRQERG
jgi:branched-subunit amino acid transport protein AzlD